MEAKYKLAIKAGVIGAIVLIVLSLFSTLSGELFGGKAFGEEMQQWGEQMQQWGDQYSDPQNVPTGMPEIPESIKGSLLLIGLIGILILLLMLATYVGTGVLAAKYAAAHIKGAGDAAWIGAIAGVVAEVIHRVVSSTIDFVLSLILPIGSANSISEGISSLIGQYTCCLPVMLVVGAILAAIGAIVYFMIKKPKAP